MKSEEIDTDYIMQKVRNNLKKRNIHINGMAQTNKEDINYINSNWDLDIDYRISSHRSPIIAKLLIIGRTLVHGEVKRYVNLITDKQTKFNVRIVQILNNYIDDDIFDTKIDKAIALVGSDIDTKIDKAIDKAIALVNSDIDTKIDKVIDNAIDKVIALVNNDIDTKVDNAVKKFCELDNANTNINTNIDNTIALVKSDIDTKIDKAIALVNNDINTKIDNAIVKKFCELDNANTNINTNTNKWKEFYKQDTTDDWLIRNIEHHNYFISLVDKYASQFSKGNIPKLAEIGIGTATMSIYFSRKLYDVLGIDNDPIIVAKAIDANKKLGGYSEFVCLDAFNLQRLFKEKLFDVAFSQGTLEHFDNDSLKKIIDSQLHIAKCVIFSVPSINYPDSAFGNERKMSLKEWEILLKSFGYNIEHLSYYQKGDLHVIGVLV